MRTSVWSGTSFRPVLLAAEQHDDGGWTVDFAGYSPATGPEWRPASA